MYQYLQKVISRKNCVWILAGGRGAGGWQVYFVDLAFGDMKKEACYNFYLLSVGVLRGLRICITSVWVGIQLFIPMRSRIQLFYFYADPPGLHFESLNFLISSIEK